MASQFVCMLVAADSDCRNTDILNRCLDVPQVSFDSEKPSSSSQWNAPWSPSFPRVRLGPTKLSWTAIGPSELEPAATPSCTPATARTSTNDTHTSRKPLLNFHSKPLSMARSWPWTNLEGQIFTVSNTTEQKGRAFTTSFST